MQPVESCLHCQFLCRILKALFYQTSSKIKLDGSLPANPVNDRRIANAVTLKSTFCLP